MGVTLILGFPAMPATGFSACRAGVWLDRVCLTMTPLSFFDPNTPCLLLNTEKWSAFSKRNMLSHFSLKHGLLLAYLLFFTLNLEIVCSHKKSHREVCWVLGATRESWSPRWAAVTWRVDRPMWQGLIFGKKSDIWIACEVSDL